MPKAFYKWEAVVWRTVWNRKDQEWVFSHNAPKVVIVRAETDKDVREMLLPTLQPEQVDDEHGIKVSSEWVYKIYCRGRMKQVTEWQVVDEDALPRGFWRN